MRGIIHLYVITLYGMFLYQEQKISILSFKKAHDVIRTEILDQILNRLLTKMTNSSKHYIGKIHKYHPTVEFQKWDFKMVENRSRSPGPWLCATTVTNISCNCFCFKSIEIAHLDSRYFYTFPDLLRKAVSTNPQALLDSLPKVCNPHLCGRLSFLIKS